ncbi:MAG: hypothetical protein KDD41_11530 [Flavobacteriales bacterium]|nr:hypothetical protein [Flavobacteriales bacterium]
MTLPVTRLFLCVALGSLLYSCGDEESHQTEDLTQTTTTIDSIDLASELGIDSGQAKLFTMPTPVQVASALNFMGVSYNDQLLLPHGMVRSKSDIDLSLALGMYMADMGYVTVYSHPQKGMDYAKDVQAIMEELPIAYYVNEGFSKRFQDNLQNRDSLSRIILQGYNDANQYITETENEGIGLLILTGAYIEGFYFAIHSNVAFQWTEEYTSMIVQQKQFLDNFLMLLKPYQIDSEVAVVYGLLTELNTAFEGMEVSFNDKTQAYELSNTVNPINKKKMRSVVGSVRDQILENIQH